MKKARIIGTGSYLPERVLSNADLEKIVDTNDEWIVSRTGMKERRIAADDEFTSDMGIQAAKAAVASAGIDITSVDCIIVATLTPDYIFPSTASLIQQGLGLEEIPAVDMQAACTGYIYALAQAKAYVESGMYQNILVIASEKLSAVTDYEDRNTCVLFGDGAAACVVSNAGAGYNIDAITLGCDGTQSELLYQPAGGSRKPASIATVEGREHYIKMNGKEVFKHAVRRMESASVEALEKAGLDKTQVSWLVPHQANTRIIETLAKRFEIPMDRVFMTIHKYGNTSASAVGIALDELEKTATPKVHDHILLTAFGAGLTWGAAVLTKGEA
ncbi:MAG: ketoacyl-ACP synthase III [Chlamydiia bacterium]|nr:ketoacyl-ACP synthase III [Chlamydiia bacterium]MCP5491718.1 ketoacyl-ACP synthase III [Chlamydiales bacterium]